VTDAVPPTAGDGPYHRRRIRRRVLVACLAVLGVVLAVDIALPLARLVNAFGRESPLRIGWAALRPPCDALPCDATQRMNVLLLGLTWNPDEGLTDTILFASFEVDARRALLVSVPRDLSVPFPDGEFRKINEAYRFGEMRNAGMGGPFTAEVVGDVLGARISRFAIVDISGLEAIVDDLHGVPVAVDHAFTDELLPNASFDLGWEWLSGERALTLMRARHGGYGEESDFARIRRQQKVLLAIKDRLFSPTVVLNPVVVHHLVGDVIHSVRTNLRASEIVALARLASNLDSSAVRRTSLAEEQVVAEMQGEDGTYLLEPAGIGFEVIRLRMRELLAGAAGTSAPANGVRPLAIVARQEWDAHPPSYQGPPQVIRRIVVHHDGVHYDGSVPGSEKMRRLLQSVQRLNGWPDVPYHFIVDVDGRVYEGRAESWPGDTKTDYDPSGLHIALQGDFSERPPTAAQLDALARLVELKASQFHIEPTEIYLHNELAETQCPGAGAVAALAAAPWRAGHAATAMNH
jgi:LCP family protein required for cell wall assembly